MAAGGAVASASRGGPRPPFPRKTRRGGFVAAALFLQLGHFGELGCSADRRGGPAARVVTPLATTPLAAASAAPAPAGDGRVLDLEAFAPLLSQPLFKAAGDAVEAGDSTRAVREVESVMARGGLDPRTLRSLNMLLGRLREEMGDFTGAAGSYDLAAAQTWELSGYAALGAGRSFLRAGRTQEAIERLRRVPPEQPIAQAARLALADAVYALGDTELAIATWRQHLAEFDKGPDVAAVALRLGDVLAERASALAENEPARSTGAREALALARRAIVRSPDAPSTEHAHDLATRALALLPASEQHELSRLTAAEDLEQLRALVESKQNRPALQVANELVASLPASDRWSDVGCEAGLLEGRALGGLGERGTAEARLVEVGKHCKDADIRARAWFLAGRFAAQDKRWVEAVRDYELLETNCAANRLADDARLKRALCYQELGAEGRYTDLLTRMPDDYPDGDMVLDGLFELSTRRLEKGDWSGAMASLERAASLAKGADARRGQEFAGRERYFLARAWAVLGDPERSLAEYEAIVRELPLSYYMLHAYSRLAAADAARADAALADARVRASTAAFTFSHRPEFDSPGFARALELLRVGDAQSAAREIDTLGLLKSGAEPSLLWAVALLYARAGAAKQSHFVAQGLLTDWLGRWPAGDWQRAWQIVFPRPYHELVAREAKRNAVPEYLVYAVMREESSFDPAAESPVKAYGLMQLIEPTARRFGKSLGLRADPISLKRPAVNVAIGCRVLSDLQRTFPENPLLAIPGYNAGAGRPERWIAERPSIDFDVWVERIPFQETRRYTKRVLASRATYAFLYAPDQASAALRLPLQLALPARAAK